MFAFFNLILFTSIALLAISASAAPIIRKRGESHTVTFKNTCSRGGTPTLVQSGQILSTGKPHTSEGPLVAAIAYLQLDNACLLNGEHCTTVEITLVNPTAPGAGSSVDVSLISPHAYNAGASFKYSNGCDGQGQACTSPSCRNAFRAPTDYFAQTQCEIGNVDLEITFSC